MNTKMNGKKIKAVYWPDAESEKGRCLVTGAECGDLYLSATYHGDHDEIWVVQERDGKEIARHNPRYIETIQWAEP